MNKLFDKDWFQTHQTKLLWLCNHFLTKHWFRWVMCIDQKQRLTRILPNSTFWIENGKRHFDIRTHAKYSKRLYFGFYYLWATAHWLDMKLINNFVPKWNLGFDAFPSEPYYPDTGTGSTTVDGLVRRGYSVSETWSTIVSGDGTSVSTGPVSGSFVSAFAASVTNKYDQLNRAIYTFDTSPIGAGDIGSAVFSIYGVSKANTLGGSPEFDLVSATPASDNALANADYGQLGTTVFSSVTYDAFSTSGYNDYTMNSNGRDNIAADGISGFGQRLDWDTNDSFGGTWASRAYIQPIAYFSDQTGTNNDPKLTGTYTPIETEDVYEPVDITEILQKEPKKVILEPVEITETVEVVKIYNKSISEPIDIGEVLQKEPQKVILEPVDATETLTKTQAKEINEPIDITETTSESRVISFSEIIKITTKVKKFLNGFPIGIWTKVAKSSTIWKKSNKP